MFRKLYNQAIFTGALVPDGPVLIVQGGAALDPVAPDLAFVRTVRQGTPTVYLPGSSLKGVLRAHGERILATALGEPAAEDPFQFDSPRRKAAHDALEKSRGNKETPLDTPAVFRLSCEADRLFGSTEIAGRFRIGDAYPSAATLAQANQTEIRYGVAINRAKQSVQVGPFEQEAVTAGEFEIRATLENFELWMLALVLQVFRDLHDGLVQVGHAKSRGFGSLRVEGPRLAIRWPGEAPEQLEGAGSRETATAVRAAYGLAEDRVERPAGGTRIEEGLFQGYRYDGWPGIDSVLGAVSGVPWKGFVARARGG
jgi:CRISPR/Cas system CSM-associated protein Csm3 (group 7 of RAMP superfamily)